MYNMSEEEILRAFKALKSVYKAVLNEWLSEHFVKGTKYTLLVRPETIDEDGYTHLHERIYCKPLTVKSSKEIVNLDYLPLLPIKKMDELFAEIGLPAVNWKYLSTHYEAMDRLVDYINEDYKEKHTND